MPGSIDIAVSAPAWFVNSIVHGRSSSDVPPDLRLEVLRDDLAGITVEVDEGTVRTTEAIFLAGHGLYKISDMLSRKGGRVRLRLQATLPRAA